MVSVFNKLLGATVVVGPVPAVPVESEVGPGVVASVVDPVVLGPAVVVSLTNSNMNFNKMYTFNKKSVC